MKHQKPTIKAVKAYARKLMKRTRIKDHEGRKRMYQLIGIAFVLWMMERDGK
jgi:nitric oxide reductase large subunit